MDGSCEGLGAESASHGVSGYLEFLECLSQRVLGTAMGDTSPNLNRNSNTAEARKLEHHWPHALTVKYRESQHESS